VRIVADRNVPIIGLICDEAPAPFTSAAIAPLPAPRPVVCSNHSSRPRANGNVATISVAPGKPALVRGFGQRQHPGR